MYIYILYKIYFDYNFNLKKILLNKNSNELLLFSFFQILEIIEIEIIDNISNEK